MSDYDSLNHSTWECKYHIVWIPKYRRKKLYVSIRDDLGQEIQRLAACRECRIEELALAFGDESHIIYVNGQYRGDDAIGRLMHDFSCADPDDMNSSVLAGKARYLKKDEKGVRQMSIIMEELIAEDRREQAEEFAITLLKSGKLTNEEIAKTFNLPEERVRELAEQAAEPVLA